LEKAVSGIVLTLLLIGVLTSLLSLETTKAEPGTIIVPDDYPTIGQAVSAASWWDTVYVRAGTYFENILIGKPIYLIGESPTNTTIDGGAVTDVIRIMGVYGIPTNALIANFTITNCASGATTSGIYVGSCRNITIINNNIMANNGNGILLGWSFNCTIAENKIMGNAMDGLFLWDSLYNTICSNDIMGNSRYGIQLFCSQYNTFRRNIIGGNSICGVFFWAQIPYSDYNNLYENNILYNGCGIYLDTGTANNKFYHNNVINNTVQFDVRTAAPNIWDDGYPSGGNYWSNYNGTDSYSGAFQNETGSDGIGDTPYIIDADDQDGYPLMISWDVVITSITPFKTIVCQGYSVKINVTVENLGVNTENFNVTVYANETVVAKATNMILTRGNSTTVTFTWGASGFAKGKYAINALAPALGDARPTNYLYRDGWIIVTMVGDINADKKVDLKDVFAVGKAYGSVSGDPRYNPNLDINDDGKIDLKDYFTVCKNFGKVDP